MGEYQFDSRLPERGGELVGERVSASLRRVIQWSAAAAIYLTLGVPNSAMAAHAVESVVRGGLHAQSGMQSGIALVGIAASLLAVLGVIYAALQARTHYTIACHPQSIAYKKLGAKPSSDWAAWLLGIALFGASVFNSTLLQAL